MRALKSLPLIALALMLVLACHRADAQSATTIDRFDDLTQALGAIGSTDDAAKRDALVDQLWQTLETEGRIPFIDGTQVAFLYRGQAKSVVWSGEWSGWDGYSGLKGKQVGSSDLWAATTTFPADALLYYFMDIDYSSTPIPDPANPQQTTIPLGTVSILTMPDHKPVAETLLDPSIPRGAVTDDIRIDSKALGYTLAYRVYTPVGYEKLDALPTIYVLDGQKFVDDALGRMPIVLDNMIARGEIQPAIAVFIDTRNPDNHNHDRREVEYGGNEAYGKFLTDELIPAVDHTYRTAPEPDSRVLLGISSSGVATLFIGFNHPDIFHKIAPFSPSVYEIPLVAPSYKKADTLPLKFFVVVGNPAWEDGDARFFIEELLDKGYDLRVSQVMGQGHSWHLWTESLPAMLAAFLPA